MSEGASRHADQPSPGARILYVSYDGMCDPLGGSQVLPYLIGLSRRGYRITLISFEKPERSSEERAAIQRTCSQAGIDWHPLPYHKRPPVLSSIHDVRQMYRLGVRLHKQAPFDLVHCRSYLPSLAGLRMKRRFGIPFVFDMRGFWADERVDGGIWRLSNPVYRSIYRYFKKREAEFLRNADHIVTLTEKGKNILLGWRPDGPPISVIPCCVDFDAFPPVTAKSRAEARKLLGIASDAKVAVYLGSFGSWYMVDEMMDFFRVQLERRPDAIFLIISREPAEGIVAVAQARGIPADRIVIRPATRAEVPRLAAAADFGLFFIKPVFSKSASSPTKMGELLALELPMMTNDNVGDVGQIIDETGAGVVVGGFNADAYRTALDALDDLNPDIKRWRSAARKWFDLGEGIDRYAAIYLSLVRGTSPDRR
jgi:glycosyltransferase involved in cell wall biosynthesis